MNPEERALLERVAKQSQENHEMLKSMYLAMRLGRAWRIFYWILIIGVSVGSFYFLQPYINQMMEIYNQVQGSTSSINKTLEDYRAVQQ